MCNARLLWAARYAAGSWLFALINVAGIAVMPFQRTLMAVIGHMPFVAHIFNVPFYGDPAGNFVARYNGMVMVVMNGLFGRRVQGLRVSYGGGEHCHEQGAAK